MRFWASAEAGDQPKRAYLTSENIKIFEALSKRPGGVSATELAAATGANLTTIYKQAGKLGISLNTPLIRAKRPRIIRSEQALVAWRADGEILAAINSIVPRGIGGQEDICQDIALAVILKQIDLNDVRAGGWRQFKTQFWSANFEGRGFALSLDAPMEGGRSRHELIENGAWREL